MVYKRIGRSAYEKNKMIELLDAWGELAEGTRNAIKQDYGWNVEQDFNHINKRDIVHKSLKKMKCSIDYASYDEIKYSQGLAEGYKFGENGKVVERYL